MKKNTHPQRRYNATETWLALYLKAGPRPPGNRKQAARGTVITDGLADGHKFSDIQLASYRLGVRKYHDETGNWLWMLPSKEPERFPASEYCEPDEII